MNSPDSFLKAVGLDSTAAEPAHPEPSAVFLADFQRPPKDDPNELLKRRFLCRGGGMLLVGPTGVGKSTLTTQMLILWALGRPAFGIQPAGNLRSLVIQAENDEGDISEIRDGITNGLGLSEKEARAAGNRIQICQESKRTGLAFFDEVVSPLIKKNRIDLLVIDPALSYLGGESNSQRDVGEFLRNRLNPILQESRVGAIVVHHTNKPPSGKEKPDWTNEELAYLGAGSAEWANWSRAVIALRGTKKKDLEGGAVYDLCLGKRGSRAGWRDAEFDRPLFSKSIRHARLIGDICWHEVPAEELATVDARDENGPEFKSQKGTIEDIYNAVPPGMGGIEKKQLINMRVKGIGLNKARDYIDELVAKNRLMEVRAKNSRGPAQVFLSRVESR